jgi:hypothetical protein
MKKAHAKSVFQSCDEFRNTRRGDFEAFCSRREASSFNDADERSNVSDFSHYGLPVNNLLPRARIVSNLR